MKQVFFNYLIVILFICAFIFPPVKVLAQAGKTDLSLNPADYGSTDFSEGANNYVYSIALQPDGKMILGGNFTSFNGKIANYITRIDSTGRMDNSFNMAGIGTNGPVVKLLLQQDGKILLAGNFSTYNGTAGISCIRLNNDGSRDTSFKTGSGANAGIRSMAIQADGKILIGGSFTAFNGWVNPFLIRLNTNGTVDENFNTANTRITGTVISLAIHTDGRILAGMENSTGDQLCRLLPNGQTDSAFNAGGTGADLAVKAICIQPDQKIIIGGNFNQYNTTPGKLIRLLPDGTRDPGFATRANNAYNGGVNVILYQPNGKILVSWGDHRNSFDEPEGRKVERLNADGTTDASFKYNIHPYLNENIFDLALQNDGKFVAGETIISRYSNRGYGINGEAGSASHNFRIRRFTTSGSEDFNFLISTSATGANKTVKAIAIQPDGKIIAGGRFYSYNGSPSNYLVRLLPDGNKDASFNTGGIGPNSSVSAIAIQPDGKILVAGVFTGFNNIDEWFLLRLNNNGSQDASFHAQYSNINAFSSLEFIRVLPDGKILIGADGTNNSLLRLNADGTRDFRFTPAFRTNGVFSLPIVYDATQQTDGKLIVGGHFDKIQGLLSLKNIARVNPDGTADNSFNPTDGQTILGANNDVRKLIVQPDGKIIIAGLFTTYSTAVSSTPAGRIARLLADGSIDGTFNPGGTGANGNIYTMLQMPDGKMLIAGDFTSYNDIPASHLARLLPDGNIDLQFNPDAAGANATILTMAIQPDYKKLLIAGDFTSYNNTGRNRIARLYACNPVSSISNVSICANQLPYLWNGNSYNAAGVYSVALNSAEGCDSIATLNLSTTVSAISGPVKACAFFSTPATYTVTAPSGSTITWSVSNSSTMQIVGGQGTSTVQVSFTGSFTTGTIYASVRNLACGLSARPSLAIGITNPSTPGIITASTTDICPFIGDSNTVSYRIRKVSGATGYLWESPSAALTIIHPNGPGPNDTLVNIYLASGFANSSLSVKAINECGTGSGRILNINRNSLAAPGSISGPTQVCDYVVPVAIERATYTIAAIPGISYTWTAPPGAIIFGQGTNSISFYFPAGFTSGIVSVTASNGCGNSSTRSLTVKASAASSPANIILEESTLCPNRVYSYSIPTIPINATSLQWSVPAGSILISGQGTTRISVNYPDNVISGFIGVKAFNTCGGSSTRKLAVNLSACRSTVPFSRNEKSADSVNEVTNLFDVNLFPNPSSVSFKLEVKSHSDEIIRYRIYDAMGKSIGEGNTTSGKTIQVGQQLAAGTYFISITQSGRFKTLKMIKW